MGEFDQPHLFVFNWGFISQQKGIESNKKNRVLHPCRQKNEKDLQFFLQQSLQIRTSIMFF